MHDTHPAHQTELRSKGVICCCKLLLASENCDVKTDRPAGEPTQKRITAHLQNIWSQILVIPRHSFIRGALREPRSPSSITELYEFRSCSYLPLKPLTTMQARTPCTRCILGNAREQGRSRPGVGLWIMSYEEKGRRRFSGFFRLSHGVQAWFEFVEKCSCRPWHRLHAFYSQDLFWTGNPGAKKLAVATVG